MNRGTGRCRAGINIPAMSEHTLGPSFIQLPSRFDGVSYFAVTGHEHQWGTNVYVEVAESADAPGMPVYDIPTFLWDEPETVTYNDDPFHRPRRRWLQDHLRLEQPERQSRLFRHGSRRRDVLSLGLLLPEPQGSGLRQRALRLQLGLRKTCVQPARSPHALKLVHFPAKKC